MLSAISSMSARVFMQVAMVERRAPRLADGARADVGAAELAGERDRAHQHADAQLVPASPSVPMSVRRPGVGEEDGQKAACSPIGATRALPLGDEGAVVVQHDADDEAADDGEDAEVAR